MEEEDLMQRRFRRTRRPWWILILALVLALMPTGKAEAQYMGFGGYGYGYPGWGWGYPGWGWGGYGYPSIAYNYGYPGYGLGNIPISGNFIMGGPGIGYGGMGYGYAGMGYGYGGYGYAPGGIGMSGVGYWNPMFGVGLTPLGTSSYMMETQVLGRVPRSSIRYGGTAYRGW
jgi:hypothetical protein